MQFLYVILFLVFGLRAETTHDTQRQLLDTDICQSVPGPVRNVNVDFNNVSWTPPENSECIKGYKVTYENKTITTDTTYLEPNKSLFCTPIQIVAITKDGKEGTLTETITPGPIRDLTCGNATKQSVSAKWQAPENVTCVIGYNVELRIKNIENGTCFTNDTNYTFSDLNSCETFNITVTAVSYTNASGPSLSCDISTLPPINFERVQNLMITDNAVRWEPPRNKGSCILTYGIETPDIEEIETNDTEHDIEQEFCAYYNVSVRVVRPSSSEVANEKKNIAPGPVKNLICENESTSVFVKWETPDNATCVALYKVELIDTNNHVVLSTNYTEDKNYAFSDLRSCGIYNINVTALTSIPDISGPTISCNDFICIPPPDVFETVENLTIIDNIVEWEPPPDKGDCSLTYKIKTKYLNEETNDTNYSFDDENFCANYKVSVWVEYPSRSNESSEVKDITLYPPKCIVAKLTGTSATLDCSVEQVEQYVCEETKIFVDCEAPKENNTGEWIIWNANGTTVIDTNSTNHFSVEIKNISQFTNYTCKGVLQNQWGISEDNEVNVTFKTHQGVPDSPEFKKTTATNTALNIEWSEPRITRGIIINYTLTIIHKGPEYSVPETCPDFIDFTDEFNVSETQYQYNNVDPSSKYEILIKAWTCAGNGTYDNTSLTTEPGEPAKVQNLYTIVEKNAKEHYDANVSYGFEHPCNTNGELKYISVFLNGKRFNKPDLYHYSEFNELQPKYSGCFPLQPEYNYTLSVHLYIEAPYCSEDITTFISPSGVPPKATKGITLPTRHDSSQVNFTLSCDLFSEEDGEIKYYAIILGEKHFEEKPKHGFWDGTESTWPEIDSESNTDSYIDPYQATEKFWNPFENNDCNYSFILGNTSYSKFNKPLENNVPYMLKVRGFTNSGYRDTDMVEFQIIITITGKLGMILGIIFGIVGTLLLLGFVYILRKKRMQWKMKKELLKSDCASVPTPIPVKNFIKHYNGLKDNNEKLKQEFSLLTKKSAEVILPGYDGLLPENKKKNRYTNVIPYDERRVKLLNNDDGPLSNYINASYILGYSGINEYIATQGPLENTCEDFWTMVMQENVTLIVMVAQFVEQNKNKCFKYFPENHEVIELENDIRIKCVTELDFKTHIMRTLLVQKELQQWTITHLQYVEWPDFGCPEDTNVILEICQTMREHVEKILSPIIVHCSAGIGRTGTLMALDIILQAVKHKQEVDVFGTVLNLRRDRRNMVQTERQYFFIHTCIKDALENPNRTSVQSLEEPVYENVDEIKKNNNKVKESQL